MRVGFICNLSEADFQFAAAKGFEVVECNLYADDITGFLGMKDQLKSQMATYGVEFVSLGRFGRERLSLDPATREKEHGDVLLLIDACADLGIPNMVIGSGSLVDGKSFEENCALAIEAFRPLLEHAKSKGVTLAVYNCRWSNFVCTQEAWSAVMAALPELGIKYDPSHAIYDGADYLKETRDWGNRFAHVHAKGSLIIDGERFDDPPAGMDQTNWGAWMALLYHHGYKGDICIESHSETWGGERYYPGIMIAKRHLEQFLF